MKMSKILQFGAVAMACALVAQTAQAQGVKVNGKEIPQSRIEMVIKSQLAQGQQDTPELRNAVREELISREVVAQEAARRGLDKKSEVASQLALARQEVLTNAFFQDYLRTHPVTEESLMKEYDRIRTQLGNREYKARHILVDKEEDAREIIAQIKKGESFEKLAERSKDPGSKERGGELNWAVLATYVKPFADALARLKKGQMTDTPVQSGFGWHVIRLDDERAYQPPSFEKVKPNLQRNLQQQQIQKAVSDLRAKAKIE